MSETAHFVMPAAPPIDVHADVAAALAAAPEGALVASVGAPEAAVLEALSLPSPLPEHWDAPTEAGSVQRVPLTSPVEGITALVLVGAGDGGTDALRRAGAALARAARRAPALVVTAAAPEADETARADATLAGIPAVTAASATQALVEGLVLGSDRGLRWGKPKEATEPVGRVLLVGGDPAGVDRGTAIAQAQVRARHLAAAPSNVKNPTWLADAVAGLVGDGVTATVRDEEWLRAEGFGGILAVSQGSESEARLVQLEWPGAGEDARHVVLVGKGVTYDSGGLSIKPAASMKDMKTDMSGAAIVAAVMSACRALDVPVRVTALLPMAENAVDGRSVRPGDIITHYGGLTDEIVNTDAEGRLLLGDCLAYADAVLEPDEVIDIATLTGAAANALGRSLAPVFGTDDALVDSLLRAGEQTGEALWRFPLVEDYAKKIHSDVADLVNAVMPPTFGAGAITAALFLREFVGERPWAHLDIAGTGRAQSDTALCPEGPSAFGVRLLLAHLASQR